MPDQKAGSTASAQEKTFTGLRRFNLIMGFLHLIQGVFMWVVSNDTTYPIFTWLPNTSGWKIWWPTYLTG